MKIKTVVFDMDGTLLNSNHQIPDKTFSAIKQAQANGIEFILASGRGVENMVEYADALDIKYIIAHNGSVVYSIEEDKTIFEVSIDDEVAQDLFKFVKKEKLNAIFYPEQKAFLLREHPKHEILAKHFKVESKDPDLSDIKNVQKAVIVVFDGTLNAREWLNIFTEKYPVGVEIKRSSPRSIDFNPKNISKASGLKFLSQKLNINPENTAVFGDAGNDIEMMKWAKYSYAMGNCVEEVKGIAKETIGNNNSDAIANKINEFIITNKGEQHD